MARVHGLAFGEKAWSEKEICAVLTTPYTYALGVGDKTSLFSFIIYRCLAPSIEILTVCTDPGYRRRKLANNLIKKMIGLHRKQGIIEVFLEVAANNSSAIGLYDGLNFEKIAVRPNYYKQTDGNRLDALVMKADISEP